MEPHHAKDEPGLNEAGDVHAADPVGPLLLAKMSQLAYRKQGETEKDWKDRLRSNLEQAGWSLCETFDRGGTQAYIAHREVTREVVIAFRGTEANRSRDIRADLRFWPRRDHVGYVHSGFGIALSEVWDLLSWKMRMMTQLSSCTVWLTGHSLGGALAVIAASRLGRHEDVAGVVTFGAPPSVSRFIAKMLEVNLREDCIRVITADIVSMLLRVLYRSPGHRHYITRRGRVIQRAGYHVVLSDRVGVFVDSVIDRLGALSQLDFRRAFAVPRFVSNHSISGYVEALS